MKKEPSLQIFAQQKPVLNRRQLNKLIEAPMPIIAMCTERNTETGSLGSLRNSKDVPIIETHNDYGI
jgi:hypothetical protein